MHFPLTICFDLYCSSNPSKYFIPTVSQVPRTQENLGWGLKQHSGMCFSTFLQLLSAFIKCCNAVSFTAPGLNPTQLLAHNITQLLPKDFKRHDQENKKPAALISDTTKQIYLLTESMCRSPKPHSCTPCATPASAPHTISPLLCGTGTSMLFFGPMFKLFGKCFLSYSAYTL